MNYGSAGSCQFEENTNTNTVICDDSQKPMNYGSMKLSVRRKYKCYKWQYPVHTINEFINRRIGIFKNKNNNTISELFTNKHIEHFQIYEWVTNKDIVETNILMLIPHIMISGK